MSCGSYDNNPYGNVCREDIPYPQISHESVPSLVDNLVTALYGGFYNPQTQQGFITKSVVKGRIVWDIACDPNNTSTINNIPRLPGEGLLCYITRALNLIVADNGFVTVDGVQTLTNKTIDSTCVVVVNNSAEAPTDPTPALGQLYYDTVTNHFYGWNGSWVRLDNA